MTAQKSLFPPFTCFWFGCLNLDLAWPKESLLLLHKATLQASRAPTCTSTSCALSKTHAFISWTVKSWERQEWYKIPAKAQVSVTRARPFQQTAARMITFKRGKSAAFPCYLS